MRNTRIFLKTRLALACLAVTGAVQAQAADADHDAFKALVGDYCMDCHNSEDWAGSLAMDQLDLDNVAHNSEVWETAINKLRGRLMPPAGQTQPDQALIDDALVYLESSIDSEAADEHIG